jgi:hypothetical protein
MTKVNAEQYRDLIDACSQWRASLMSAATSHEQRVEHQRLTRAVEELRAAVCPRAKECDRERAARVLETCDELLAKKKAEFKAADAALCRMAFGEEWR